MLSQPKKETTSTGLFVETTLDLQINLGRNSTNDGPFRPGTRHICPLLKLCFISEGNILSFPLFPFSNLKKKRIERRLGSYRVLAALPEDWRFLPNTYIRLLTTACNSSYRHMHTRTCTHTHTHQHIHNRNT